MKPMLFDTDMVRALLEDRKTVTRRGVKPMCRAEIPSDEKFFVSSKSGCVYWSRTSRQLKIDGELVVSPYLPGDILYARETWAHPSDKEVRNGADPRMYLYKADIIQPAAWDKWRPSIHMPREAARIFLRVTDVRIDRLNKIIPQDIRNEGSEFDTKHSVASYKRFIDLWDSTIKPADRSLYGWDANPWVWVIEFERCDRLEEDT